MKNKALIVCFLSVSGQIFSAEKPLTLADKKAARQQRQERAKAAVNEIKEAGSKSLLRSTLLAEKVVQFREQRQAKKK